MQDLKEHLVEQVPLFASLPDGELQYLVEILHQSSLPSNTVLFHEGEPGDRLYIVLKGRVEVVKALGTAEERVLNLLHPGDFVGEMGLIDPDGLRTASVRTCEPVQLLEMKHADFDALFQRRPALAYEMTRVLVLRLRAAEDATIRDLREKNRQLAQAYAELQAAQAQIIEKEKLERELQVAQQIQESILPRTLPGLAGFNFGAQMVPARAVGGDLFDFVPLDSGALGIVIGDVSDKGVPAAIFMALTHSLLRAEAHRAALPGEVLARVNRHLLEMNDEGMFVTVLYGVLDPARGDFAYARAGHEMPFLFDAQGQARELDHDLGQPLGILPAPSLDEQTIAIPLGGTLLMYTDGATDATAAQGERFGMERLRETVRTHLGCSSQAVCGQVLHAINEYQGAHPQTDDVTLVAIQANDG
jgi:sigma-B regulation protein RsbU (phosphoserine phosphatase)